jgi:hypothetical protein
MRHHSDIRKTPDKDLIAQLQAEQEAGRMYTLDLQAKLGEREALIRMLVRGFMAEERVRTFEKDSDDVPF